MPAPQPLSVLPDISHAVVIVFRGNGAVKQAVQDYGIFFEAEVMDDTIHAMLIDPRYGHGAVQNYIVELGGDIYVAPPEPEMP